MIQKCFPRLHKTLIRLSETLHTQAHKIQLYCNFINKEIPAIEHISQ